MSFSSVETSLSKISKTFDEVTLRRERLIKESREIISLSSKSIVSIHTSNGAEAGKFRIQAAKKLDELRRIAGTDLVRYLGVPEQEFVESFVIYSIVNKKKIPSLEDLNVGPSSYVLGLLDAIGELKRSVYDHIRQGDVPGAESIFGTMESLFILISPLAVYDNIAPGIRRKLDVARILIEDTRTTITEEVRRTEFIVAVNKLATKLGSQPVLNRSPFTAHRREHLKSRSENKSEKDYEGGENEGEKG